VAPVASVNPIPYAQQTASIGAAMLALIIAATLYLSLMYVCGRYTAKYAALRGRSRTAWFVLGGLFYPFPYIALALLPEK
jgi:hypothetical protein